MRCSHSCILDRELFNLFDSVDKVKFVKNISLEHYGMDSKSRSLPWPDVKNKGRFKGETGLAGKQLPENLFWIW